MERQLENDRKKQTGLDRQEKERQKETDRKND